MSDLADFLLSMRQTMTETTATDVVAEVIQRVYGDATRTALDRKAAFEIVSALRALGWASLDEVALLIEAAGGEITVPGSLLSDTRKRRVTRQDDFATLGHKFHVSTPSGRQR